MFSFPYWTHWTILAVCMIYIPISAEATCTMELQNGIGAADSLYVNYGVLTQTECENRCLSTPECVAIRPLAICFAWEDESHLIPTTGSTLVVKVCTTTEPPTPETTTTKLPTTDPPTTQPSTTQPPTTQQPTTQPPTTTTQPPLTQPPTTQPPTTQPLTTTTQPPTPQPPSTQPTTTQPSNPETPTTEQPTTEPPITGGHSSSENTTTKMITLASISGCIAIVMLVPLLFLIYKVRRLFLTESTAQPKYPQKMHGCHICPHLTSDKIPTVNDFYRGQIYAPHYPIPNPPTARLDFTQKPPRFEPQQFS